jgi:hypothetical protein
MLSLLGQLDWRHVEQAIIHGLTDAAASIPPHSEADWGRFMAYIRQQGAAVTVTKAQAKTFPWSRNLFGLRARSDRNPAANSPGWLHRERLPASNGPRAFPSLRVVGHACEQTAQLHGGRQLATMIERGTDGGGLCLGHNEHAGRMGVCTKGGKRPRRRSGRQHLIIAPRPLSSTVWTPPTMPA